MTRRDSARRSTVRRIAAVAIAAMLSTAGMSTAGCGPFGSTGQAAHGQVEKPSVTIAIIPSTDMAPLWVAQSEGYFAAEGLNVQLVTVGGGGAVMESLLSGKVDFAFASYPLLVHAQQDGGSKVRLKIVADASAATPDTTAVVVARNSRLRSPIDLEGMRVAVTSRGSMADLAVIAAMKADKANPAGIRWQQLTFPDMLPKLSSGAVDAAFLAEPFVSLAQANLGVWTVAQPMTGRLDGIPLTGYAALEKTTQNYPNTVAAFQRAVQRAQRETSTSEGDRALRQALVRYARVPEGIAPVLHLPAYPITTDPTRLQRVPDLMLEFGLLTTPFDIRPMILPTNANSAP